MPRRLRPSGPRCRGGASSLLRLTPLTNGRLPNPPALNDWMSRAANMLMPVTGPLAAFDAVPLAHRADAS